MSPKNVSYEKQQPLLGILRYSQPLMINSRIVFDYFVPPIRTYAHILLLNFSLQLLRWRQTLIRPILPVARWWVKSKPSLGPGSLVGNRAKKNRRAKRVEQVVRVIFFAPFPTKEPGPRLIKAKLADFALVYGQPPLKFELTNQR